MKIVGIILTILMTISSVASAHVDLCYSSNSSNASCENSIEECDKTSFNNAEQSQSSDSSSHSHCAIHCAHVCAHFPAHSSLLTLNARESKDNQPYSFAFIQTSLEGPFRPPLA